MKENRTKVRSIIINIPAPPMGITDTKVGTERNKIVRAIGSFKANAHLEFRKLVSPPIHGYTGIGYMIHLGLDWYKECQEDPDKMVYLDEDIDKFLKMVQNRFGADIVVLEYGNRETRVIDTNDTKVFYGGSIGTRLSAQAPHYLPVNTLGASKSRQVSTKRIETKKNRKRNGNKTL